MNTPATQIIFKMILMLSADDTILTNSLYEMKLTMNVGKEYAKPNKINMKIS
jgi:hypothetical protein